MFTVRFTRPPSQYLNTIWRHHALCASITSPKTNPNPAKFANVENYTNVSTKTSTKYELRRSRIYTMYSWIIKTVPRYYGNASNRAHLHGSGTRAQVELHLDMVAAHQDAFAIQPPPRPHALAPTPLLIRCPSHNARDTKQNNLPPTTWNKNKCRDIFL